jgi:predicted peptidase
MIVMKTLLTSLMALALLTGGSQARKWTDNKGRQIEAEFVSQDETNVVLKLASNGKPVPVPVATLSEADHEFLRAKAAEANAPVAATGKYAAQWTGSFEQGNFEGDLPFLLRVPNDLKKGGKYPLLLFLHGAGEKGNDNKKQLKHDPTKLAPKGVFEKNQVIVVAPQCPADQMWSGQTLETVIKLVKNLQKELPVDPQRTYISGLSMGGFGTWSALALEPRLFAAAIPICGGGDPASVRKFDKVPIWAFHNDGDPTVGVAGSRSMIEALKKAGGDPKYTEYQSTQHDAWSRTYKDPALYEWLFAQKSGH